MQQTQQEAQQSSQQNFRSTIMSITLLYTTGLHQELYTFTSLSEKNRWEAEVMAIKAESSAAFNKKSSDGLTTEVRTLYNNWMARVISFKDLYNENRTPMDIKWALNSAQEALGLEKTQWENPPDDSIFEN